MYKQYSSVPSGSDQDHRMVEYWTKLWSASNTEKQLADLESSKLWRTFERHISTGQPIIEAGCGLARWVVFLQRKGYDVAGIDYTLPALISAKKTFPNVNLIQADVRDLPFPDSSFAAYISLGVIEHFEDGPDAVLQEAHRVIRPGGKLLITVPLHTWLTELAAENRQKQEGRDYFFQYLFTRKEFKSLLTSFSFEVLEVHPLDTWYTMGYLLPAARKAAKQSREGSQGAKPGAVSALKRILDKVMPHGLLGHMQLAVAIAR